jgi:Bacterial extracellular solute-binding protein, family 7
LRWRRVALTRWRHLRGRSPRERARLHWWLARLRWQRVTLAEVRILRFKILGVRMFFPKMRAHISLIALLASTVLANAREFRAADIQEENHATVQAIRHMGQAVSERSGERHTVKVFHSGQLGDEGRTLEQTLAGIIDINRINVIEIGKIVPE